MRELFRIYQPDRDIYAVRYGIVDGLTSCGTSRPTDTTTNSFGKWIHLVLTQSTNLLSNGTSNRYTLYKNGVKMVDTAGVTYQNKPDPVRLDHGGTIGCYIDEGRNFYRVTSTI